MWGENHWATKVKFLTSWFFKVSVKFFKFNLDFSCPPIGLNIWFKCNPHPTLEEKILPNKYIEDTDLVKGHLTKNETILKFTNNKQKARLIFRKVVWNSSKCQPITSFVLDSQRGTHLGVVWSTVRKLKNCYKVSFRINKFSHLIGKCFLILPYLVKLYVTPWYQITKISWSITILN